MGTLNISASIGDTTSGVNQSANKAVTTAVEGIDQRVLSVGTTDTGIGEALSEYEDCAIILTVLGEINDSACEIP